MEILNVLLYTLTMHFAHKNVALIAVVEHITTNHIPQLTVTDYSKAIVQVVLLEFNKEWLNKYLNRMFHITGKINQEDTANASSKNTMHV